MTHDKFCPASQPGVCQCDLCDPYCSCDLIAAARDDEREKAAQRVDAVLDHRSWCASPPHSPSGCDCGKEIAVAAARGDDGE